MDDVLCRYLFDVRLAEISRYSGRTTAEVEAAIWTSGFDEDGDRGYFTATQYLAEFNRRLEAALTREEWVHARAAATDPNQTVFDLARNVSQHRPVALLTNNGPLFKESMSAICPQLIEVFGGNAFCSYEFGGAKPQTVVFEGLARHLGVQPSGLLFIDDTAEYIQGATAVGVQPHHFSDAATLAGDLSRRGLL
jgi:putative hydrolase of the HAD superfamily